MLVGHRFRMVFHHHNHAFSLFACRTSSARLGWGASSFLVSNFCLRLSLLAARVGLSWSTSFEAERVAVGVPPRPVREVEGMPFVCDVEAACEAVVEAIDDDEFLGRAVGGVGDARLSMAGSVACSLSLSLSLSFSLTLYLSLSLFLTFSRPSAAPVGKAVHLLTWDSALVDCRMAIAGSGYACSSGRASRLSTLALALGRSRPCSLRLFAAAAVNLSLPCHGSLTPHALLSACMHLITMADCQPFPPAIASQTVAHFYWTKTI